jgi:hypothetical protein
VEFEEQGGALGQRGLLWRLTAVMVSSSSNSMRATGTPIWMVWMTVCDRCIDAGEGADGGRHGLRDRVEAHVSSVMMPSVPSEPTSRRVRS